MHLWARTVVGGLVGAAVGWALYKFVGCKTGACPITANPWISMGVYGLLGAMLMSGK